MRPLFNGPWLPSPGLNVRRLRPRAIFRIVVSVAVLAQILPAPAIASVSRPAACSHSYDVYKVSATFLLACGVGSYPLAGTTRLPDGGTSYHYTIGGNPVTSNVPPVGFRVATASASELALYGIPKEPPATEPSFRQFWLQNFEGTRLHFLIPPTELHVVPRVAAGTSPNASSTWTGHVGYAGGYTDVVGDYTEPAWNSSGCPTRDVVIWVGLGGWNDVNLAQDGTALGNDTPGLNMHQGWYEFWPQEGWVPLSITATAGKHFYVETTYDGANQYTFFLFNVYTGAVEDFNATASQSFNGSYVDWVAERPQVGSQHTPLANFKTLTFDQAFYNNGALGSGTNNWQVNMVEGTSTLAIANGWGNYGAGANTGFTDNQAYCGYWGN